MQTERSANAKVISIDETSIDFHLLAIDANVGNPVLSAAVRTPGNVQFQVLIEARQALLQFFHQPAREALCLRDRQLAEFRAAASDRAAPERRTANAQSDRVQFFRQGISIRLGNVYDEQVLHVGRAQFARREAIGQIGGSLHLLGGNTSAEHRCSHVAVARLLLRMNSDVVAINIRGRRFLDRGVECKSNSPLQFLQKTFRRPSMPQEKKFQTRALAMFPQHFRVAK